MFGHQDHEDPTTTDNQHVSAAADPQADATLSDTSAPAPITTSAPAIDEDIASDYIATPHAAPTASTSTPTPDPVSVPSTTTDELNVDDPIATPAVPDTNGLLDLKQNALQKLSPLLGHLDQTPEEKFRTTMMMIQASDNQALLKDAYEAAQGIEDEKTRAQALLDVVNEINYFTQGNADQN
jgi:hypothetical protein